MIILLKSYRFVVHIFLRLLIIGVCLSVYEHFVKKNEYTIEGVLLNIFFLYCFFTTLYYFLKTKRIFHLTSNEPIDERIVGFKFDKITGICNLINGLIITSFFIFRLLKTDINFNKTNDIIRFSFFMFFLLYGVLAINYGIKTLTILFNITPYRELNIDNYYNKISKKQRHPLKLKKRIKKFILIRILIILGLIIIDIYVFRGLYSSKIYIPSNYLNLKEINTCSFSIQKKDKKNYVFSFENNSLFPRYFVNYRNDEYLQKVSDTLFFNYSRKNLFPNFYCSYNYNFNCGTGLDLTSINPLESFHIEKTYKEIVNESSSIEQIRKAKFLYRNIKKSYIDLKYQQIDSIIRSESKLISENDSIQVEYYIMMNSFLSKNHIYTKSNKINISTKDLLNSYLEKKSNYN